MLTNAEVKSLLDLLKAFVDKSKIDFPIPGDAIQREVKSDNGRESFLVDINRKGKIKVTKCTFQERYRVTEILLRLDIDGPTHENPDGSVVPCPHLHVYREGYAEKWAFAIDNKEFMDTTNLVKTFQEFLKRCNVIDCPNIQGSI